jgi:diguanylate cyclase (GGDEF)-like protein
MIDVDHFKRLNDTYGHLNGDRVLQGISALLLRNVRKSDVVCRFGGEEFALLLPDTTAQSATELMDRIRRKIQKFRFTGTMDEPIQVTISAGIAHVNTSQGLSKSPKEVISDALALADKQLYIAKESGRNQVCANG